MFDIHFVLEFVYILCMYVNIYSTRVEEGIKTVNIIPLLKRPSPLPIPYVILSMNMVLLLLLQRMEGGVVVRELSPGLLPGDRHSCPMGNHNQLQLFPKLFLVFLTVSRQVFYWGVPPLVAGVPLLIPGVSLLVLVVPNACVCAVFRF